MRKVLILLCAFLPTAAAYSQTSAHLSKILVELPGGKMGDTELIAIKRIREYTNAIVQVETSSPKKENKKEFDLTVILGTSGDSQELKNEWQKHASAREDSYLLQTSSNRPLTVLASGTNKRGTLYAAYQLADLLKAEADISKLNLYFEPKIQQRYVSFGATTHGRRYYRPALYYQTLKELPRYGYNGVLIYPGGGTPIGRQSSPVAETESGKLYRDTANTQQWKNWFKELKTYQHDIVMTIPPMIPPGYTNKEIVDFYDGGPEPKDYITNLKSHYKEFLQLLTHDYPEIDSYLFNSTEGATFGRNERFFGAPAPDRFPNQKYMENNERIMRAYFDVLSEFFKSDLHKVSFWTHSFGLTSEGITKMREILFQYPQVLILEDDYWNNNLWPNNIPAMKYLSEGLRAKIHTKNPFGMFQIATDGEYFGGGSLPNAYPGSHVRSAKDALARNARMVVQRLDLHDRTPYGTSFGTMEIVPITASKQLWNPVPDEATIWQDWASRRFGKKAAPFVVDALKQSEPILANGLLCNGIDLLGNGSEFNTKMWSKEDNGFAHFQLFGKPGRKLVQKTDADIIYSEEYASYQMDTHTIGINDFLQSRDKALQSVAYALDQIQKAKPYLKAEDYTMLNGIFVNGRNVINALKLLGSAAYATNIMMSNFDHVKDPKALFDRSIANLEAYIKAGKLIPEMNQNLQTIAKNYKQVGNKASPR
ncbi:MAG: putative periplasmic protein [Sphingobacteriaceae bacterium]|nr:putative periplasmic protein [Sphingobacteriaceae bacterium]